MFRIIFLLPCTSKCCSLISLSSVCSSYITPASSDVSPGVELLIRTSSRIAGAPSILTMFCPFHNSQTSCDVDDMSSSSAAARCSLARPTIAFSHCGPPIRIADITAVMIPNGAIEKMIWSPHPIDWLRNCFATCSPKSAKIGAKSEIILLDIDAKSASGFSSESFILGPSGKVSERW